MTCPLCKNETDPKFRPFCSQHCANIDLGRWFNGSYRTPSLRENDTDQDLETRFSELHEENHGKY